MPRAILLFPSFAAMAPLREVRARHDPLAAKIGPHVTLVFPFESILSDGELEAHVSRACLGFSSFELDLGPVERSHDGFLWLPVVRGGRETRALHDRLYTGPLAEFLDRSRPYVPHLTVARSGEGNAQDAWRDASALTGPFHARIDRVIIEQILLDQSSLSIGEIPLTGERGAGPSQSA